MALEESDVGTARDDGGRSADCPVCGQPYQYRRPQDVSDPEPEIRADASVCKSVPINGQRTLFIHLGGDGS